MLNERQYIYLFEYSHVLIEINPVIKTLTLSCFHLELFALCHPSLNASLVLLVSIVYQKGSSEWDDGDRLSCEI